MDFRRKSVYTYTQLLYLYLIPLLYLYILYHSGTINVNAAKPTAFVEVSSWCSDMVVQLQIHNSQSDVLHLSAVVKLLWAQNARSVKVETLTRWNASMVNKRSRDETSHTNLSGRFTLRSLQNARLSRPEVPVSGVAAGLWTEVSGSDRWMI